MAAETKRNSRIFSTCTQKINPTCCYGSTLYLPYTPKQTSPMFPKANAAERNAFDKFSISRSGLVMVLSEEFSVLVMTRASFSWPCFVSVVLMEQTRAFTWRYDVLYLLCGNNNFYLTNSKLFQVRGKWLDEQWCPDASGLLFCFDFFNYCCCFKIVVHQASSELLAVFQVRTVKIPIRLHRGKIERLLAFFQPRQGCGAFQGGWGWREEK